MEKRYSDGDGDRRELLRLTEMMRKLESELYDTGECQGTLIFAFFHRFSVRSVRSCHPHLHHSSTTLSPSGFAFLSIFLYLFILFATSLSCVFICFAY